MKGNLLKAAFTATAIVALSGAAYAQGTSGSGTNAGQGEGSITNQGPMTPQASGSGAADTMSSGTMAATTMPEGQVRELQQALKDAGHDVTVDGKFGSETQSALRSYQQAKGMQATGQPDSQTLSSLGVGAMGSTGSSTGMGQGSGATGSMGGNNMGGGLGGTTGGASSQ